MLEIRQSLEKWDDVAAISRFDSDESTQVHFIVLKEDIFQMKWLD